MIKKKIREKTNAIVSSEVGNYEKHPFFVKKAEASKALLEKVGLPSSCNLTHHNSFKEVIHIEAW